MNTTNQEINHQDSVLNYSMSGSSPVSKSFYNYSQSGKEKRFDIQKIYNLLGMNQSNIEKSSTYMNRNKVC